MKYLALIFFCCLFISCAKAPEVEISRATRSKIEATVSSVNSGIVRAEQIAELAFGAVGRVKTLNVKLGDVVEKDFIIAEVENQDALIAYEAAKREFSRQQSLSQKGASSPSIYDQAISQLKATEEAYNRTLIKAPFKGVISELNMEVGQLSQITTEFKKALIRIVDLSPRYVRAEIDEVDMPKLRIGQQALVKILAMRPEPFKATLRKIVPFINSVREEDRTCEIELDLASDKLLTAGASADVEIITETRDNALTIPIRTIFNQKGKKYVFKIDSSKVIKTEVALGLTGYEAAEVLSGLSENDLLANLSDKYELFDGMKVKVLEIP